MPKRADTPTPAPDLAPSPLLVPIASGDARLPSGLMLGHGAFFAQILPDGRALVADLPEPIKQRYYPDLYPPPSAPVEAAPAADVPPTPAIDEV